MKQNLTLEEAANKANGYTVYAKETKAPIFNEGFIAGAKWQQEQAKEMDREQKKELIIATYTDLKMKDCQLPYGMQYHNELLKAGEEAEQYYKETFKQEQNPL